MFSRRKLFQIVLTALGAGSAAFSSTVFAKKLAVKLSQVPSLEKIGGSVILKLGARQVILIRDSETHVRALSARCTHRDCFVAYSRSRRVVICNCHSSLFDLRGKVLKGPAKKNLQVFKSELSGDRIVIEVK